MSMHHWQPASIAAFISASIFSRSGTLWECSAATSIAGWHAALLVGLATALGAGISMGLSEGLSDDGKLTGRGSAVMRGVIIGAMTFVGGALHSLPFLIGHVHTALAVAYVVVA